MFVVFVVEVSFFCVVTPSLDGVKAPIPTPTKERNLN